MCQSFDLTEEEFDEAWKLMPKQDRAFISALSYLNELLEDDMLCYRELPIEMQQFIAEADRGTCFSILAECLAALLGTSVMDRVKRGHKRRGIGRRDSAGPDGTSPKQRRRRRSRRHSRSGSKNADSLSCGNGKNGDDSASGNGASGDARPGDTNGRDSHNGKGGGHE